MSNPFSRIIRDAEIYLNPNVLDNKPEMALLVVKIFAVWASIEHELRFLLVRVLGTDARPAIAIYETLTAPRLQLNALDAAAKTALPPERYEIFSAVISIVEAFQTPRNHLAHWIWGGCRQRPDLLALIDPETLKENDFREAIVRERRIDSFPLEIDGWDPDWIDPQCVLAYSINDLTRALRDIESGLLCLGLFAAYLAAEPRKDIADKFHISEEDQRVEQDQILARLSEERLFHGALSRIRAGQKKSPGAPDGSPPPNQNGGS
jgi:hypothetical protein